jgi:hypothetical protein
VGISQRSFSRLVVLTLVACVGLGAASGDAFAAVPANDSPSGALAVDPPTAMPWTSLTPPAPYLFHEASTDWPQATTSPTEDTLTPSCTPGVLGDHSVWFKVAVSEPSVLRATVQSGDLAAFQPVVTILSSDPQTDPSTQEVGCGTTSVTNSVAVAEGYVTPGTAYIRVAQVGGSGPPPEFILSLAGRDITPPTIAVKMPAAPAEPGVFQHYDASGTTDGETSVDATSATWTFHDGLTTKTITGKLTVTYKWVHPGAHRVSFRVADTADNFAVYTFVVFVLDRTPPRMHLALAVPFPGDRHLRVALTHSERVVVRLVVFQGGRRLFTTPRRLTLAGKGRVVRLLALSARVASTPRLVVTGTATDTAGNTTPLPTCELDPVRGTGHCYTA